MIVGELLVWIGIGIIVFCLACLGIILVHGIFVTRKEPGTIIGVNILVFIAIVFWLNYRFPEFSMDTIMYYKLW
jgi:hypothetical protein